MSDDVGEDYMGKHLGIGHLKYLIILPVKRWLEYVQVKFFGKKYKAHLST